MIEILNLFSSIFQNKKGKGNINLTNKHVSYLNPARKTSPYTLILIVTLIVLFIFQVIGIVDSQSIVLNTQSVVDFQLSSAFTSLFFHSGPLHLFFNVLVLYFFSRYVEREIGVGTIFLFLAGGFFANILASFYAQIISDHYLSIGASSGIASLIFFTIIAKPFTWLTPLAWASILIDILNFSNYETQTNHAVHVTGYIAALLLMSFFNFKNKKYVYYSILFNLIGLLSLYFGFFVYGSSIMNFFI